MSHNLSSFQPFKVATSTSLALAAPRYWILPAIRYYKPQNTTTCTSLHCTHIVTNPRHDTSSTRITSYTRSKIPLHNRIQVRVTTIPEYESMPHHPYITPLPQRITNQRPNIRPTSGTPKHPNHTINLAGHFRRILNKGPCRCLSTGPIGTPLPAP